MRGLRQPWNGFSLSPLSIALPEFGLKFYRQFVNVLCRKNIVSFVPKFDPSPSLVVVHDQREKRYNFVEACVAFRSMLTSESLRFAYSIAGRDFVERMASLFIVLVDGGQPLPTFVSPLVPVDQPQPSTSAAAAVASAPAPKPGYLLQSLAPGSARKRPNDSRADPAASKRIAS